MSGNHDTPDSGISTLVEELEDVEPEDIRTRVLRFADDTPPPLPDASPSARELVFPILTLALSVLLIVAVVSVAFGGFRAQIRRVEETTRGFLTGEGLVLAEFRKQTEEELEAKDRAIIAALTRLTALETERRELDELVDARVLQRERELVAQLEGQLETERSRLESTGADEDAINREIGLLRTSLSAQTLNELDQYRRTVEQDIVVRALELQSEVADVRSEIELASVERTELLDHAIMAEWELLRAQAINTVEPSNPEELSGTAGPEEDAESFSRIEAELREEIAQLENQIRSYESERAGLVAQVDSLQNSLESGADAADMASRIATLESQNASQESQLRSQGHELADSRAEYDLARARTQSLQTRIAELTRELDTARNLGANAESRVGTVAEQARTQALQDVLGVVSAYEPGADTEEFARLLAATDPDRLIAERLGTELTSLIAEAQRAVLDAQLEYRPLGTVSLVGQGTVTVQRLVTLAIQDGMLAEIRGASAGDATALIARGIVSRVEPQRFAVQITEQERAPAISDRVFVAVPRQR